MQGIVTLKDTSPRGRDAVFFIIPRTELRAVLLEGNEVTWSLDGVDYETEFESRGEMACSIARTFFEDLVNGLSDVAWAFTENGWTRNGVVIEEELPEGQEIVS